MAERCGTGVAGLRLVAVTGRTSGCQFPKACRLMLLSLSGVVSNSRRTGVNNRGRQPVAGREISTAVHMIISHISAVCFQVVLLSSFVPPPPGYFSLCFPCRGSRTSNVEPFPSLVSRRISPPCSSTNDRTIGSPSPTPRSLSVPRR